MNPKLEETVVLDFTTHNPSTGAAADADSTPTVEVFEDANDTPILTPTPTKRTAKTGNYRVSVACTAANGFEAGKSYNVVVTATVGGVTGKAPIQRLLMRTRGVDDVLPTSGYTTPPTAAAIRSEIDANSTKLDTNVGSRLATAGYTAPPTAAAVRTEMDANSTRLADVPGIKAKTDNLPADPASNTQVNTRLATAGYTAPDNAGITAVKAKTDQLGFTGGNVNASVQSMAAAAITQILDAVVEGTVTIKKAIRGMFAALLGRSSGHTSGASSPKYRDLANAKDRISATTDADGNRTAVTLDLDD